MYYLILTITIICVYYLFVLFYLPKQKKNIKIESFVDKDNLTVLKDYTSLNDQQQIDVEVNLNLVYLDPKYDFTKTKYLYGKKHLIPNTGWKQDFERDICHHIDGGCQCIKAENGDTICGVSKDSNIYECPGACSKCNQCHQNKSQIHLYYKDFCNKSHTKKEKEKCELYKERLVYTKGNCFFTDNTDPRLVKKKEKCDIFKISRYNGYFVGQDIIFKLSFIYTKESFKDKVKFIEIESSTLNNQRIKINNFYTSKDDIYFFIPAEDKYRGLSQIVNVRGKIFFKENIKPTIDFNTKTVINIVAELQESEDIDELESENIDESNIKDTIGDKISRESTQELESNEFDRFSNNYLGENRYYKCQIVNNYSVKNPITKKKNGVFVRKKLMDNPETWKQRVDINRPWDY